MSGSDWLQRFKKKNLNVSEQQVLAGRPTSLPLVEMRAQSNLTQQQKRS